MKLLVLQIICAYTYLALSQENVPKNEAFLLSSVYDAMRNNLQANLRNNLNKNDVLTDLRNKRNVNERTDYGYNNNNGFTQDDYKPTEEEEWPVKSASEICTSIIPKHISYSKISFTNTMNSIGNGLAIIAKVLLTVIAITALPLMLFTAFILPFKVLMGIKTMAVANSLLVGSLLYRHYHQHDDDDDDTADLATNTVTDTKVATVNSAAVPVAIEDYNEIGEQEANRILRFVNKKNKDW